MNNIKNFNDFNVNESITIQDIEKRLNSIAEVKLPGEEGYVKLDGKDAEGFIKIARKALKEWLAYKF